jgi:predicted phosphodiesterase
LGILYCGDPHGDWRAILRAADAARPGALVLLGDMGLRRPLEEEVRPALDAGARVLWIAGNHDVDSEDGPGFLFGSALAGGNLSGRVAAVGGLRVAGLGGVFQARVWHPRAGGGVVFRSRAEMAARLPRGDLWRGGLPRKALAAVWREDYEALWDQRADVLVTHEAPSCHRHGFAEIDELARSMGARLVVHGHHHESYGAELEGGIAVAGIGRAEARAVALPPAPALLP